MTEATITIEPRFRGPDGSGNGGYSCGLVAQFLAADVEVTLRRPPPLDRPLRVELGGVVRAWDDETLVAEATPVALDIAPPARVTFEDAQASSLPAGDRASPFPNCFVCGRDRAEGDGLRIFAGPVRDSDLVAATWVPTADLCRPEFVWAALDCPGAYACEAVGRGDALLGRLAAHVERVPEAGERCVVVGWPLGEDGRKLYAGTALLGERGDVIGVAKATWILPRA